jgi:hypothetical protein
MRTMRTTTKAAGFFAAEVADVTRSADFARIDWLTETTKGAKLFRRAGEVNAKALSGAIYQSFGLDMKRVNEIKVKQRAAAKRDRKLNLPTRDATLMREFNRVAKSVQRARDEAFGRKAARTNGKGKGKVRVSKAAQGLLSALKALGYSVKVTGGPAK